MNKLSSKAIGNQAENVASNWLIDNGYHVIARNWQVPKICEIDIIAIKQDILFFVEVKFRRNTLHGDGLEYISPKKLAQMELAAEHFLQTEEKYQNLDWCLYALSLSGAESKPIVECFVEVA